MLELPEVIRRLSPGLLPVGETPSLICIHTSKPKYLVFLEDATAPAFIAQFGYRAELERLDRILTRLHGVVPHLVARPIALSGPPDGTCLHLQAGLPGTPWFRIRDRFRTRKDWGRLARLAQAALDDFTAAVASVPEWSQRVHPGAELRRQAALARQRNIGLSTSALRWIDDQADRLDPWGEVESHWQHGDFCLNNLLVGDAEAGIIDFDEFGRTAMPLHDAIGLALSLRQLGPGAPAMKTLQHEHLTGLYLHHLLWRIDQSFEFATRAAVRAELIGAIERAANCPGESIAGS